MKQDVFSTDYGGAIGSVVMVEAISESMVPLQAKIQAVAPTRTTVLLTGETGTGKGLMARRIHESSSRRTGPFVAVHCGAMPDTLLESELFGHEKGSFTGAIRRKLGKFELANGGTLFLDEIGTISPSAQIKLLDVLQERHFTRVGGETEIEIDVRLIAATNADLAKMQREGSFRADLFFRLNVFPIEIPPLRERQEDILGFVEHFLRRCNALFPKDVEGVTPEVLQAFQDYAWPGNARELENVLERAHVLANGRLLNGDVIPPEIMAAASEEILTETQARRTLAAVRRVAVETAEQRYLTESLARHCGRIDATAAEAGITPRQLHKLLTRYGIKKESFKHGARGSCLALRTAPQAPKHADPGRT